MGSGSNTGSSFEIVGFVLRMLNGCCKACGTEPQLWRVYSPRLIAQTCLEFASSVVWVLGCAKLNPPLSTFCRTFQSVFRQIHNFSRRMKANCATSVSQRRTSHLHHPRGRLQNSLLSQMLWMHPGLQERNCQRPSY